MTTFALFLAAACTVALLFASSVAFVTGGHDDWKERLTRLIQRGDDAGTADPVTARTQKALLRLMGKARGLLGLRGNERLRARLSAAGLYGAYAEDTFLGAQSVLPLAGIFVGSFLRSNEFLWITVGGCIGWLLPGLWLDRRGRQRREAIRRGLPDAMDLLVICVDAGLGLDQAILRVRDELASSHPVLQEELHRVHLEQAAGSARLDAWRRMAERSGTEEMLSFTSMLTQSERFGTPIARALSRFADDLRGKRRQRAEEAAAKTKVKIIFPLVFFIFPCMFIVLLAPALIGIVTVLMPAQQ